MFLLHLKWLWLNKNENIHISNEHVIFEINKMTKYINKMKIIDNYLDLRNLYVSSNAHYILCFVYFFLFKINFIIFKGWLTLKLMAHLFPLCWQTFWDGCKFLKALFALMEHLFRKKIALELLLTLHSVSNIHKLILFRKKWLF